jgi:gamma-glutamyltranspeptidase/glutathione hydrolase
MLQTPRATRGAVVAPHHLAAQAGLRVLRERGNAIEAMVAAASTIAVVYPHTNSLGGDNFWLITDGHNPPLGVDACGAAAASADVDFYRRQGHSEIPSRGPLAANTVAGAVSGWQRALELSKRWGGTLPLARLLEDAEHYAREGIVVTRSQYSNTVGKRAELEDVPPISSRRAVLSAPTTWRVIRPSRSSRFSRVLRQEPSTTCRRQHRDLPR